jgi:hypothetical protein
MIGSSSLWFFGIAYVAIIKLLKIYGSSIN